MKFVYLIYKSYFDSSGNTYKVELVECDFSETAAHSFSKLYNLQRTSDQKNRAEFTFTSLPVIE